MQAGSKPGTDEFITHLATQVTRQVPEKGWVCRIYYVYLPKHFLQRLGWQNHDNILFSLDGDQLVLTKLPPGEAEAILTSFRAAARQRARLQKRLGNRLNRARRKLRRLVQNQPSTGQASANTPTPLQP